MFNEFAIPFVPFAVAMNQWLLFVLTAAGPIVLTWLVAITVMDASSSPTIAAVAGVAAGLFGIAFVWALANACAAAGTPTAAGYAMIAHVGLIAVVLFGSMVKLAIDCVRTVWRAL